MPDEITDEAKRCARAFSQWELGDPNWADRIIAIITADDPETAAMTRMSEMDNETFERIYLEAQHHLVD